MKKSQTHTGEHIMNKTEERIRVVTNEGKELIFRAQKTSIMPILQLVVEPYSTMDDEGYEHVVKSRPVDLYLDFADEGEIFIFGIGLGCAYPIRDDGSLQKTVEDIYARLNGYKLIESFTHVSP